MAGSLRSHTPGNGRFFIFPAFPVSVVLGLLVVFFGCSSSEPQVMQVEHYLVAATHAGSDEIVEALVLSLDIFDPDGDEELAEVVVMLADYDLHWTLPVEELAYHEQDGQRWYTTAPLTVAGQTRLPRGSIQITVVDLAGREDRREVQLPTTLPEVTVEAAARIDESGMVIPADEQDTLLVVVENVDGLREVREVADVDGPFHISRVFERGVVERLQKSNRPLRIWLIHEWNSQMQIESGPWEIDADELLPADQP